MISACGVICSDCPAYLGAEKGPEHQRRTVEAWKRIYGRPEEPGLSVLTVMIKSSVPAPGAAETDERMANMRQIRTPVN